MQYRVRAFKIIYSLIPDLMAAIFSKPTGYALRALIYLAQLGEERSVLASEIAAQEDIPASFVGKVLGKLAQAGMVDSTRGPNGGYRIALDPERITLRMISELFETQYTSRDCLLGFKQCPGPRYCAVHERWLEPQKHVDRFLDETTLAILVTKDAPRQELKKYRAAKKTGAGGV